MTKVLVVTPAYCTTGNNRLPLLLQTIYWVKQQTHQDYIHIVVDDGSTDNALEVLNRLSQADPKLIVLSKTNGGSSSAINYAIERMYDIARPDYITICHSDDVLFPDSLEIRLQLALQTEAKLVYSDAVILHEVGGHSQPIYRQAREYKTPKEMLTALLYRESRVPYETMFWDAEFFTKIVGGFDARITSAEDWDIAIRSAKALVSTNSKQITAFTSTVVKRNHEHGLMVQNIQDGTKDRCYELILRKHLKGDDYSNALSEAKRRLRKLNETTNPIDSAQNIRQLNLPGKMLEAARGMIRMLRMRRIRAMLGLRREPPPDITSDDRITDFLRQMDQVRRDSDRLFRYAVGHRAA